MSFIGKYFCVGIAPGGIRVYKLNTIKMMSSISITLLTYLLFVVGGEMLDKK